MFTVCGTVKDYGHVEVARSCRMSMLHYKSDLLKTILTFVFAPLLVFGYREEKQLVTVELFSNFLDDSTHPATNIDITIHCRDIQLYSAQLQVVANFTGLRYLMFNWPVLSALIGKQVMPLLAGLCIRSSRNTDNNVTCIVSLQALPRTYFSF